MRKCKIGIVGFGTVGSGIYKILTSELDSHPILKEIEISKIAVKDLNKKRDIELDNNLLTDDPFELINDPYIDIIVEVMLTTAGLNCNDKEIVELVQDMDDFQNHIQ